ncbi:MAG: type II toxin-antitoxin system VapC family toxin [Bryobacteraceae bacterium]
MASVLADTHTILWYLTSNTRISRAATDALDATTASGEPIYISAITLVEIRYLVEKGRLSPDDQQIILAAIDAPGTPIRLAPVDRNVAAALEQVPREEVPDMPDRIIAATALALGVPLLSRDGKIRASRVLTIW